eukprot:4827444-Pleurochrysis_carterae.AAC.2
MFFRLDPTYSFESPSAINPTFPPAQSTGSGAAPSGPAAGGPAAGTRSGCTATAQLTSTTPSATAVPGVPPRSLTTDERA